MLDGSRNAVTESTPEFLAGKQGYEFLGFSSQSRQ